MLSGQERGRRLQQASLRQRPICSAKVVWPRSGPAVQRELEDLAALIDLAGGTAYAHGFSSGALLTLHAAAAGLPIAKMTLLEPPYTAEEDVASQAAFTAGLREQLALAGDDAALEYFLADILPDSIRSQMRSDGSWAAMAAVAPTLVHDSLISESMTADVLADVRAPSLVLESQASNEGLREMATEVARLIPGAQHRSLAGTWHGVPDDVLAAELRTFLRE